MLRPRNLAAGLLAPLAVLLIAGASGDAASGPDATLSASGPNIGGCAIFPASNAWNRDVSADPVDPRSDEYLVAEAGGANVHLDLGVRASEGYGIPVTTVSSRQKRVPIKFGVDGENYGDESDHGPAPIPAGAAIEGGTPSRPDPAGGDRHVLIVQRGRCILWELYHGVRVRSHGHVVAWKASSVARWDLTRNSTRHAGWTSADAAGLPILPGLLRYAEASAGAIRHALRVTLPTARSAYTAPASHCGPSKSADALPYGARLRLRASWPESRYTGAALTLIRALKRYGLIFADQGSPLYISGTTDPGWARVLDQVHGGAGRLPSTAFEVLKIGKVTGC